MRPSPYCLEASMNSIFTRRSIRAYIDRPVEDEKIERILRAAMQAPSAKNAQPWEFIVVRNKETLAAISEMHAFAGMAKNAAAAIVTLADTRRSDPSLPWFASDMAACTQNILLQIVEEGLGGVWLGFYPRPERILNLREYFALPDYIMPFSVVPFGYTERENKFKDRYLPERVHWERY